MLIDLVNLPALRAQLTPALAAQLEGTGDLPPGERARIATNLRAQLAACAAYVPAAIVRAQLAAPQPGRVKGAFWAGSLLFADVSGFTALSERLSVLGRQGAEEVSAILNHLFDALIAEVDARQGMLLKFGGDALTVFFGAESLGPAHAAAAAATALAMQQRMAAFASMRTRAGTSTLSLRAGVHSGRVFAAEVGDTSHIELVITGPEVNKVALAQEIAEPGQVVISDQTAALIPGVTLRGLRQGFHLIRNLPHPELPPPQPDPIPPDGPDDLPTLVRLAEQMAALRPYLIHGLPRRFLDATATALGEFRPVSVLFANIHDFSAILDHLQDAPDTAAAVFNAYYRRAQAVVHRYEGIVNKVDMYTHGDKFMALFGAPTAHEDDPTRAVRCALELKQALAEANAEIAVLLADQDWGTGGRGDRRTRGPEDAGTIAESHGAPLVPSSPRASAASKHSLAQKIGLTTGTVFAGRVGGATRHEYTVMGPAVNLAARLMAAAPDGDVFLSPGARAAVAGQFVMTDGAPLNLKGFAAPVTPTRVLRVAEGAQPAHQYDRSTHLETAPLVGRDTELETLRTAARAALTGQGRVLAITGEAGTGKTRLAEELLQHLVVASVSVGDAGVPTFEILLGECQSYEQRTPYAALRGTLRGLLSLGDRPVAGPELAAHLTARVRQLAPDLERFAPLLGDALGGNLPETPLTEALTPQQRHDRLQELIVALFQAAARRDPLLVLVEDVHWADLPSQELLSRLALAASDQPLLLVLTYRPEPPIEAPWKNLSLTVVLRLAELSHADSATLLGALLGGTPPPDILPLLDRTQGNPFFIEELVRALIAGSVLQRDAGGSWRVARRLAEVALPTSIEGLLMARLDRLDEPRRELVQVASVIGRRFQRPVVEGVHPEPATLDDNLTYLINFELIQAEQLDRTLSYLFRHALLHDVAYEGILYARRRKLHCKVARRIEELHTAGLGEEQPALLGWHYLQAEEWEAALTYSLRAADQAARRFANNDALALYATALEITGHLEGEIAQPALLDHIMTIHERSGELRLLLGEYDQAETHLRASLELAVPGSASWLRLHRLLASVEERRSRYDQAFDWLHTGMARGIAALKGEMARCYILGAGIYFRQGIYLSALEWARMGLQLAESVGSPVDQAQALKLTGNIYREQGDLNQAIDNLEQARVRYEEQNRLDGLCDSLNDLGQVYLQLGRWPETMASFERSLALSKSIGDVLATARASNNLAVVLVGRNQLERAGELYALSSAMFERIGSRLGVAVTTYNRGEVLLLQGRPAEAIDLFSRAITTLEQINARNFVPEVLRLTAEAALAMDDLDGATTHAARSVALAAELGMLPEEAIARRVLGQIALARSDLEGAAAAFEQSRAALAGLDSPYELGKTRYQQARLARAQGDTTAYIAARTEAETIFAQLDAQRDLELVQHM